MWLSEVVVEGQSPELSVRAFTYLLLRCNGSLDKSPFALAALSCAFCAFSDGNRAFGWQASDDAPTRAVNTEYAIITAVDLHVHMVTETDSKSVKT